jgi:hypothetical protein
VSEEDEADWLAGSGLVEFLESLLTLWRLRRDSEPLTPALSPSDGERESCPVCGKAETSGWMESSLLVSEQLTGNEASGRVASDCVASGCGLSGAGTTDDGFRDGFEEEQLGAVVFDLVFIKDFRFVDSLVDADKKVGNNVSLYYI